MHNGRVLAVLVGFVSALALASNTVIVASSGITQSGSMQLAIQAAIVHIGGVVIFGLVAGYLLHLGNRRGAKLCMLMVLGSAAYSAWQVASFATAEVVTQTEARIRDEKQAQAYYDAQLKAGEDIRKAQTEMARDQLKWSQTQIKTADGRQERRDTLESGAKVIEAYGKAAASIAIPAPPPKVERQLSKTEALAGIVAGYFGWDVATLQAWPQLLMTLMGLIIEIVGWPLSSYLWMTGVVALAGLTSAAPEPTEPQSLTEEQTLKTLPAPGRPQQSREITVRANPTPDWRALLDRIDFPPGGARHKGPRRPKDRRDHAALRFLVWMGAYREVGDFPQDRLVDLYLEFCSADHREQWGHNIIKAGLADLGKKIAVRYNGPHGVTWSIVPPAVDRLASLLEKRGVIEPGTVPGTITPGSVVPFRGKATA
jgi:hypothetical protein